MTVVAKVTSADPRLTLGDLLVIPLGLDVWEVGAGHVVLRAEDAQLERLERMGYGIEQLHMTESYLSRFATPEAIAGYHSAQTLEQDLRRLADEHAEIAELHQIGRSIEDRPIFAL